jgi:hypothetical protein
VRAPCIATGNVPLVTDENDGGDDCENPKYGYSNFKDGG